MPRGVSASDQALLQGRLWTPAALRPGMWFDASDISTITISTGVSEWRDRSGNGRTFTQTTASKQPAYNETGFNGRPTLIFDGANSLLSGGASSAMTQFATTGSWAVFYAGQATSTYRNANAYLANGFWGDTGAYLSGGVMNSPDVLFTFSYDGTVDVVEAAYTFDTPAVIENSLDGTNIRTRVNGGTAAALASGATLSASSALQIGGQYNAAAGAPRVLNGRISEMLFMRSYLQSYERQLVEGYLGWKWGIPLAADHPFTNRPPLIGD